MEVVGVADQVAEGVGVADKVTEGVALLLQMVAPAAEQSEEAKAMQEENGQMAPLATQTWLPGPVPPHQVLPAAVQAAHVGAQVEEALFKAQLEV